MYESEGGERHGEIDYVKKLWKEVVSLKKASDGKQRSVSEQKGKKRRLFLFVRLRRV